MIQTFFAWGRRIGNKIRIAWLETWTNRIERVVLEDKASGKKHQVTIERELQKVCDHKNIREIAPTMWACTTRGCRTYFQINYKVMLTEKDLLEFLGKLAETLRMPDPLEEKADA